MIDFKELLQKGLKSIPKDTEERVAFHFILEFVGVVGTVLSDLTDFLETLEERVNALEQENDKIKS